MATMIPPHPHDSTASLGEIEIFRRLRDDPHTKDWIVLHSLDIARHVGQVSGEADFVIIVPALGVLCLEVKACRTLKRRNGVWFYGQNQRGDPRGPFKQSAEAMHSLRQQLIQHRPDLNRIVFWSGVIFPYLDFREVPASGEWHEWQVIDGPQFRSRPLSTLVTEMLVAARNHLATVRTARWFFPQSKEPYEEQCKDIAEALRPNFLAPGKFSVQAESLQAEVARFTEEQFTALDAMEDNPRVAFIGPAGTGKTVLAMEAARRGASKGRRMLFLCFNRLLSQRIDRQLAAMDTNVVVRTIHSHMMKIASPIDPQPDPSFWVDVLPDLAVERMLDNMDFAETFDEIIIDEAQDILRSNYLDVLDLTLVGGLSAGRWRIFGDFENQAIYSASNLSLDEFLKLRGGDAPKYRLRINCRNSFRIAHFTQLIGNLSPGYSRVLRPDEFPEPTIRYYSDARDQQSKFIALLNQLYSDGYRGSDIVVLSPKSDAECLSATIDISPWKERLKPYSLESNGDIGYCSIHAFKGLEASAVVVTDIGRIDGDTNQDLLYVASSRALHRLAFLIDNSCKRDFIKVMARGLGGSI